MSMSVEMVLRLIDRATGPLRGVESELNRLKNTADRVNAAQAAGTKVRAADWLLARQGAAESKKEVAALDAAMLGVTARAAGAAAVGGVAFAGYGLKQAIAFEKEMADVKKKLDLDPGAKWEDVENVINKTSRDLGIARVETARLTAEAASAGIEYKDIGKFIRLAAEASAAWTMAPKEAAERLAYIKAQTEATIPEIKELAEKINLLGDKSAGREADILTMFQKAGPSAKAAGLQIDTTLAALTALRSTGMAPDVGGRFFNAFVSKMATIDKGGRSAKNAAEGLKELGLSVNEFAASFKADPTRAIDDLLDRIAKSPNKVAAATRFSGQEWWDETIRFADARAEYRKQRDLLGSGKAEGSLSENLKTDLETTARKFERTKAMVSEIGEGMMKWALPPINDQLEKLLNSFDTFKKTGFLAGPDGKPIDRVADKTPISFSDETRRRWLKGIESRAKTEPLSAYERRLDLDRAAPKSVAPTPIFTQPRFDPGPRDIPGGRALPTFAGLEGAKPHIDLSQLQGDAGEAKRIGQEIKASLDVKAAPEVDMSGAAAAREEAKSAGDAILNGLNVKARPEVDTSSIAAALGMARTLKSELAGINAAATRAGATARRGVAAGSHALHDGPEAH